VGIGKSILRRAVVWLILGLIGGGIAADLWWRQATRGTDKQVKQLQTEIDSEKMRAQQLESKLAEAGGELQLEPIDDDEVADVESAQHGAVQ